MFPSRRLSVRTTRQCQTPPSKLSADSCPSLAPRLTGTRSSATRSAKRCKTLRTAPVPLFLLFKCGAGSQNITCRSLSAKSPKNENVKKKKSKNFKKRM